MDDQQGDQHGWAGVVGVREAGNEAKRCCGSGVRSQEGF